MQQALDAMRDAAYDEEGYTLDADLAEAHDALRERLAHCDRCGKKLGGEGDIHTCTPDPIGDAQSALIDQCFNTECVEPCRKTLALTTDAGSSTTTKTVDDWLAKVTPMNIAIGAVLIAIGSTLLMPPKKTKKNKRGSR